jgi:virginiamycin B lyase
MRETAGASLEVVRCVVLALCALGTFPLGAWTITETPLGSATSHPNFIIVGPDGNMWFTEYGTSKIGVVDSRSGELLHEYPTKTASCGPVGLTLGSDGNVWYACISAPVLGRMSSAGTAAEFAAPVALAGPIVSGGDGYLYYSRGDGRVEVADTTGVSLDFVTFPGAVFGLSGAGDGFVWVASSGDDKLWGVRYDSGLGTFHTRYVTVAESPATVAWCPQNTNLYWVGTAPSSEIGYAQYGGGSASYALAAGAYPQGLACSPDGDAWYAASSHDFIARYSDPSHEFPVSPSSYPYQLALGPDGSVWFTENGAGKIGRLRFAPSGDVNASGTVDVGDVFYLVNYLFAGGPAPQ